MFRKAHIAMAMAGCSLLAPVSTAVEYRFDPAVFTQLFYDDNMRVGAAGREIKSFGLKVDPKLNFGARDGAWSFDFDTRLSFLKVEDDVFDTEDQTVDVRFARSTPLTVFQVSLRNQRATNNTDDFEDLVEFDFRNARTDRQTLSPVFQWILTEKNRLIFSGSVENMHYDALSFDDYDYNGANIGWEHYYSEKVVFNVTANATKFDSESAVRLQATPEDCFNFPISITDSDGDGNVEVLGGRSAISDFQSDTIGITVGMRHQQSERFNYSASIGITETDTTAQRTICGGVFFGPFLFDRIFTQDNLEANSDSLVVDVGLSYRGEKYAVDANLSRALVPIGLGFLTQKDELRLGVEYQLAEKIGARLNLRAYTSDAVDDASTFNREVVTINPSLQWQFLERWRLDAGLRYRSTDSNTIQDRRDGTRIYVGVNYAFKPKIISR